MNKVCRCSQFITLTFVGDLLLSSRSQREALERDPNSFRDWLGKYSQHLVQSDLLFANFEGVVAANTLAARDKGLPPQFTLGFTGKSAQFLKIFKKAVLSLSNNHIADFGYRGIEETLNFLRENNISYAGAGTVPEAYGYRILEQKGIRIGFLAFTDLLPREYYAQEHKVGAASAAPEAMRRAIARAQGNVDLIVVSLHTVGNIFGGPQYFPDSHQKDLARICAEAGANIVFGHQQHCLQDFTIYKECLILHGLGALIYDPGISKNPYGHRLKKSMEISGGAIAFVDCCKHGIRSFRVCPTRNVRTASGQFTLKAANMKERILVLFSFAKMFGKRF